MISKEDLAKLFILGVRRNQDIPVEGTGIFLFSQNMEGMDHKQVKRMNEKYLKSGTRIIAVDQEGGNVQNAPVRYGVPDPRYQQHGVRGYATNTGKQLVEMGFNLNLAPLADVGFGSGIGDRSFSDNRYEVARKVEQAVQGYNEAGILCCLKHFPGYGDSNVDAHWDLPYTLKIPPLDAYFKAKYAPCVMMGHIDVGHLDFGKPASRSERAHKLLRDGIGFNNVIMTDDIWMKGFGEDKYQGIAEAFISGTDIILISNAVPPDEQEEFFRFFYMMIRNSPALEIRAMDSIRRVNALHNRIEKDIEHRRTSYEIQKRFNNGIWSRP